MAIALRYVDLVFLVAAVPVFIAAELPLAALAVISAVWIAQHGIEMGADRAASRAIAKGDRRAAMGWIAGTTLARVWIVALAVLLVGLLSSDDAGLAAAVLAAILFTVHFAARLLARLLAPADQGAS